MKKNNGFTLVELSISLVIISLLVSAILTGQDLIKSAELKKIYTIKETIQIGVNTFKVKYNCIPGDCRNATDYFGTDSQGCSDATLDKTPKSATCNGDNNGKIEHNSSSMEEVLFWQHLSSAGLINGTFRGGYSSTGIGYDKYVSPTLIPDTNTYLDIRSSDFYDFYRLDKKLSGNTISNVNSSTPAFNPSTMLLFDTKFDDGKPASGGIQSANWNTDYWGCTNLYTADADASPQPNSVYNTALNSTVCYVIFNNLGF
jgi:prepilin-type N-terminal cleavage/methylation domain-containing protein